MVETPKAVVWREGFWHLLLAYPVLPNSHLILNWNLPPFVEQTHRNYIHLVYNLVKCIILTIIVKS